LKDSVLSFEDEWRKIDDGVKERNWIVMLPNGNHVKIPLPWGYNVFKVAGDISYDVISDKKDLGEGFATLLLAANGAFNPVSSSTLTQTLSPTIADPFVQISENKNWFGSPIKPEQPPYQPQIPESQRYFSSVRPASKEVAEFVNKLTGGTKVKSGFIDVSPEHIDHMIDFLGGGTGRFIANVVNDGIEAAKGDMPAVNNIPFARKFYGEKTDFRDTKLIYEMIDNSIIKEYSDRQKQDFEKAIKSALKEEMIDQKQAKRFRADFTEGQRILQLSKENPDLDYKELKKKPKVTEF